MQFHRCVRYLTTVIATFAFIGACTTSDMQTDSTDAIQTRMGELVTTEWLIRHLGDPDLVVLDCTVIIEADEHGGLRAISGRANYESGHIPTAGFADLMGDLSDPDSPLKYGMPTPEQFAAAMGALGVGDDSRVVLYSATYPDWAARVWWMLRWAGFDQVALLDGGLQAWIADGRALSTAPANRPAKKFTVELRPEVIADRNEVLGAIDDTNIGIIDTLPVAHFRGEFSLYDRPGHIPSATNLPSSDLLNELGHYRTIGELEMMHDSDRERRAITYCGGGVAASSVAFTMHRLGFTNIAVYMGSLQEWAADPANPMTLTTD